MSLSFDDLLKKYGEGELPAEYIDLVPLDSGSHVERKDGLCAMELAAWIAGQPHSDHPPCVSPVLINFGVSWNDSLTTDEDRNRLIRPILPRMLGTADDGQDEARGWLAMDWLIREFTPTFLELHAPLHEQASALRALSPISNKAELSEAMTPLNAARTEAAASWDAAGAAAWDAAWAAAGDAAWAAAWDAAGAAAWDAAWAAARAAAGDAAWDAAGDAARAAAWAAAGDAAWDAAGAAAWAAAGDASWDAAGAAAWEFLAPTVAKLQESAQRLLIRMIDPKSEAS